MGGHSSGRQFSWGHFSRGQFLGSNIPRRQFSGVRGMGIFLGGQFSVEIFSRYIFLNILFTEINKAINLFRLPSCTKES